MPRIPRIDIPSPRIRSLSRPVIRDVGPPVIRTIDPPVINVPNPIIDYPTIDVPTEQDFRQQMSPQRQTEEEETDERELPTTPVAPPAPPRPTINIGGIEAPLPEPAPLVTAGATAIVTTAVTLGATIVVSKVKDAMIEPLVKKMANPKKKKKIKIKQVKPVLHYVLNEHNGIDILEYSQKGTKVIGTTEDVERYIRDQVEIDSLYEYDNKIIIDDVIKDKFTKEGAKRFKSLFAPAKSIAKKLGARFSI